MPIDDTGREVQRTYQPGKEPIVSMDLNRTSGGQAATWRPPANAFQVTPAPPPVAKKSAATTNPFFVDPNSISVNRKKNPFLIALAPALDAFGINIP